MRRRTAERRPDTATHDHTVHMNYAAMGEDSLLADS